MIESDLFLIKAHHNYEFNDTINENYQDWKITALFYTALHYIKSYALRLNVELKSHTEIFKNIDFKNREALIPLPPKLLTAYKLLYDYSIESRYLGITNLKIYLKEQEKNYKSALQCLVIIKEELIKQGLKIE